MTTLKSTSFDQQRDKNLKALQRNGFQADLALGSLPQRKAERILQLLQNRAEIEFCATTQAQRESYEIERWHSDFIRMRDIHARTDDHDRATLLLRQRLWKVVPNCRFKRFQEVFTAQHNWIMPSFDISGEAVIFRRSPGFRQLSVRACLVSADLLPEKLAENLGLVTFSDQDRGKNFERLQKKADLEVVQQLKLIWDSAWQPEEHNLRILVIQQPSPTIASCYQQAKPLSPDLVGALLYVREDPPARSSHDRAQSADRVGRRLSIQFFDNAYQAYRKTKNEARLQSAEIDKLEQLRTTLADFNGRLDQEWRKDSEPDQKRQLLAEGMDLVTKALKQLHSCNNRHKLFAHDLLESIGTFVDSRGRVNPTRTMVKLIAVTDSIEKRFREIYPIAGYNQEDQLLLEREIKRHELAIIGFCKSLRQNAYRLDLRVVPLVDSKLTPAQLRSNATGLIGALRANPTTLEGLKLRPFVTFSNRLLEKHQELRNAIFARDRQSAKEAVLKMHLIGKFHAVNVCFERIQNMLEDRSGIRLGAIRSFADEIAKIYSTIHIFPDLVIKPYTGPFEELQQGLIGLQDELKMHAKQDADLSPRSSIYWALKEYLKKFNVEKMVKDLP